MSRPGRRSVNVRLYHPSIRMFNLLEIGKAYIGHTQLLGYFYRARPILVYDASRQGFMPLSAPQRCWAVLPV
jgi:hypothetical protein